jgi:hypothetical protein
MNNTSRSGYMTFQALPRILDLREVIEQRAQAEP